MHADASLPASWSRNEGLFMERPRIVVLGGINMDLVATVERFPVAGETVVGRAFTTYPGGKGANQAVAAARLGAQVSNGGAGGR